MNLNECLGRVLACIVFISGLFFCATLPEANAQAREFWWCLLSGATCLIAGITIVFLIKRDNHF